MAVIEVTTKQQAGQKFGRKTDEIGIKLQGHRNYTSFYRLAYDNIIILAFFPLPTC